jgi:hypothetical protein
MSCLLVDSLMLALLAGSIFEPYHLRSMHLIVEDVLFSTWWLTVGVHPRSWPQA